MQQFKQAIFIFIFMSLLTGIVYPLLITIFALMMPAQSNGSLIVKNGKIMGSLLISQNTPDDKYFWPRPSAIDFDPMKPSGGSNLGPTSQKLKEAVQERRKKAGNNAPAELLYASGSGLDPHISVETAYFQVDRIAKARSMDAGKLKEVIDNKIEGNQWGILGPKYVNVLSLNQALDERNE